MQREVSGSFSVHAFWTLCWWHDHFFVTGEEGSVSNKVFVNKMQIQVLMTTVDEGGREGSTLLDL